jgi:hypothetical protein
MVTLEDIEKEVNDSLAIKFAMNRTMKQLEKAVEFFIRKYDRENGTRICKEVILGKRSLDTFERQQASAKFGHEVAKPLNTISKLNKAQKQYIFKRMGWDINEVE